MKPLRVVSLLPSATELLACVLQKCDAATSQVKLVGTSHECDHPDWLVHDLPQLTSQKTVLNTQSANPARDIDDQVRQALSTSTSLYNIKEREIVELKPDLILTQSLCQVCSVDLASVQRLVECNNSLPPGCSILDLNPQSLSAVLDDVVRVGEAVGCRAAGEQARLELQQRVDAAVAKAASSNSSSTRSKRRPNVLFIEWTDPIFVGGHWTPEIIELAGARYLYNTAGNKSVCFRGEDEERKAINPEEVDICLVCLCGMTLPQTRQTMADVLGGGSRGDWFRSFKAFQQNAVVLVDGSAMFNRPGPRLVDALEWSVDLVASWSGGDGEDDGKLVLPTKTSNFPAELL